MIGVGAQVPKTGCRIVIADDWGLLKCAEVHIMVAPLLHTARRQTASERRARSQTGRGAGNGRKSYVGRPRAGIKNRKRKPRLEDRYARNTPSAQQSSLQSCRMIEEGNVLQITHRQPVPAIKIR